jgi:hypothetical protein
MSVEFAGGCGGFCALWLCKEDGGGEVLFRAWDAEVWAVRRVVFAIVRGFENRDADADNVFGVGGNLRRRDRERGMDIL